MGVHRHLCSSLLSLTNRKLVKIGLLVFLVFEIVVILKLDQAIFYRIATSYTRQNSTYLNTVTLETKPALAALWTQRSGNLNLHLWSDTCARDLNILCNLPMFPRAPDQRRLVNETVIVDNLADLEGIRLFGFISPDKSGFYLFTVRFCSAEVWLSHNENWRNARKVLGSDIQPKKDLQISSKIALVAGNKYFIEVVSTCFRKRNKIQLLWKTPVSSVFEVINGTFLSSFVDENGLNSKIYDGLLPDSPVCTSRKYKTKYFQVHQEISYLSHDKVQDILPYWDYNPSYTVEKRIKHYQAIRLYHVHTFLYPFPDDKNLQYANNRPLSKDEALEVVRIFMESFEEKMSG